MDFSNDIFEHDALINDKNILPLLSPGAIVDGVLSCLKTVLAACVYMTSGVFFASFAACMLIALTWLYTNPERPIASFSLATVLPTVTPSPMLIGPADNITFESDEVAMMTPKQAHREQVRRQVNAVSDCIALVLALGAGVGFIRFLFRSV